MRCLVAGIVLVWAASAAAFDMPPYPVAKQQVTEPTVPVPGEKPERLHRDQWAPLGEHDIGLYREIFSTQQRADWESADQLIARLADRLLMGHVLAQRYLHPTGWISSFAELSSWLDSFADHPDARRIWRLALRRQPEGADAPGSPEGRWSGLAIGLSGSGSFTEAFRSKGLSDQVSNDEQDFLDRIRSEVRAGRFAAARASLSDPESLAMTRPLVRDMAAGEVAHGLFLHGDDDAAREVARPVVLRSGHLVPLAGWTAGLAAWRQGAPAAAREIFATMSGGDPDEPLVAASAWWAARLSLLTGHVEGADDLLRIAARHPHSLYGLLARHVLGMDIKLVNDARPGPSGADLDALSTVPALRRALALAQIGQRHRGDREFKGLHAASQPELGVAILAIADEFGFPATLYRLSREFLSFWGMRFDDALYPLPSWEPESGFEVDPALISALIRQESKFRPFTVSHAGARGLMQIIPSTAAFIAGDRRFNGSGRYRLNDPEVSVTLGQRYVRYLLALPQVDGNMFYFLAAWNGGPAKLAQRIRDGGTVSDPLLFVESYPLRETRSFIRNVMADYWIYSLRSGNMPTTLAMVAAGDWPIYTGRR